MVNDALGELANMIVGGLKTNLVECGHPCVLTIRSIGSEAVTQECKNYEEPRTGVSWAPSRRR
jgi:CheY-specific phosphatase CheX